MTYVLILAILFVLSITLTGVFRYYALQKGLLDHPNQRSSHEHPTPRGGGVVFVALFLITLIVLPQLGILPLTYLNILGLPVFIIAVLGYLDDIKGLPAKLRFAVQIAATVIFLYYLHLQYGTYYHGWLVALGMAGLPLIMLAMVWSTNLFNFMDGTDGIASFEAITIYGVGGAVLWLHGAHQLALLAWIIVASVAGFLVWNWPKAKIFMGDVASSFLGFMVIPFALIGYYVYDISVFVWFVLYLMFTLDATLTLIRRLRHREKFYEAHKLHAYQRLHQSGYSHQRVLFVIIGMNCILSALAVVAAQYTHWRTMSIAGAVVVTVLYYVWVETKKPMYAAASIGREQRS